MLDNIKEKKMYEMLSKSSDGSLPEVSIIFKDNIDRQLAIDFLVSHSNVDQNIALWDENLQEQVSCKGLSRKEFVKKITDGHHIRLSDLNHMPELGLNVFDKNISLDFKTGKNWVMPAVQEFMRILMVMKNKFHSISITLDDVGVFFSADEIDFFKRCFK